ncbi:TPA: type III secretion system translocon subunit SctE [Proteus mirabilis]|nr:type III secretion system translocon subunit SctE [Proteus mirabilis]MBG3121934.1 type III secretion system translocon subunit SctE [Proteus mirabilis]MBI6294457.1 type III secretion system translocon subunit SctE [Proteus mirabilis]MBI6326325.1 type III secretion system translocon subunit SctE [Proteus mirabilis]MBI6397851.1 type III secretion system translocon subunit SctE [Proteus mirabilis]
MNKINQSNEHGRLVSPFVSEDVKNVIKNTTKQANAINNISNYVTTQQQKENQSKFDIPLLRVPHEQERNAKRINIQDDPQYKITTFSPENNEGNTKPSLAEEEPKNNKKKDDHLDVSAQQNPSLPSSDPDHLENKKSNKDYDFLFLQLSYQHVIHEDILNKIKDPEKFDYYRDKLQKLSNGIDDLKELFKSGFNELDKTKGAFVDYWMEVYSQIKEKNFKKESEVKSFLNNCNIPDSLIQQLLLGNIHSKADMEKALEDVFPFLNFPSDFSKLSLDELDNLSKKLDGFFDDSFNYLPNISLSEDKINKITSHVDELKALINKKENESIKKQLAEIRDLFKELTISQSSLELEIASNSLSGMSLLTFLLSKTRELTLKVMLHRSESEQKLFNEMQEVTEKSLKDKVEEQKSLIKKQEEIQFWAGIGLKILGGLLTLVAGVSSIFTAGSSMVLVGVVTTLFVADTGLTIADEVYQSIHNKSFMDEIMQPISDAVMEAIDKVSDFLVSLVNSSLDGLKELGLDKKIIEEMKNSIQDKLKMATKILVTVVLFVAATALSFVIGPAMKGISDAVNKISNQQIRQILKKVLNDGLEAVLGKMIKDIIIKALEEALEKVDKQLAKEISKKASIMLNRTVVASKLTNSAATNTVNIYGSVIASKIIQSIAGSKKLTAVLDIIQKLMDKIMETYHENIDSITDILKNLSDKSSASNKLKSDMIRNISI